MSNTIISQLPVEIIRGRLVFAASLRSKMFVESPEPILIKGTERKFKNSRDFCKKYYILSF